MLNRKNLIRSALLSITLAAVVVVLLFVCPQQYGHSRTDRARHGDIRALSSAVNLFRLDSGRYPTTEEGLDALIAKPAALLPNWRQYFERLPVDPWGNDYIYRNEARNGVDFVIYSRGPNGIDDNGKYDDVVNWDKKYDCALNYKCPTACDYSQRVAFVSALVSWCVTFFMIVFLAVRWGVRRINRV